MTPLADAVERAQFGGKAAGLAGLLRAGLPVPGGFALRPSELDLLAHGGEVEPVWGALMAVGAVFAVRSSALDEDSSAASFAGQHATVLGVDSPQSLVEAAGTVRASGGASMAYRQARGLAADSVLAAVIQRLVDPIASGVLFTRDPVSRAHALVVEAAWGLGEAVVQGLVTPDRAVMSPTGEIRERVTGYKDLRFERVGGEVREVEVGEADRARECIPEEVLSRLAEHAVVCERVAGGPADVEWAWDGETLWLLQCRAITTL